MKIRNFTKKDLNKPLRLTIQKTGRLGFTSEAAQIMNLDVVKSADIGQNDENQEDKSLYLSFQNDKETGLFPIRKAGSYYFIDIKDLLDTLEIKYSDGGTYFDVVKHYVGDDLYYKLTLPESEEVKD